MDFRTLNVAMVISIAGICRLTGTCVRVGSRDRILKIFDNRDEWLSKNYRTRGISRWLIENYKLILELEFR